MTFTKTVVIIEDEEFLTDLYQKAFSRRGYQVIEAFNGIEGLEKIAQNPQIDAILLDIMLPRMDGISVLRKLKEDKSAYKKIPVCMLTNLGQESVIKEAIKIGAVGYILKSKFLPDQVVDEVEKFLNDKEKGQTN